MGTVIVTPDTILNPINRLQQRLQSNETESEADDATGETARAVEARLPNPDLGRVGRTVAATSNESRGNDYGQQSPSHLAADHSEARFLR